MQVPPTGPRATRTRALATPGPRPAVRAAARALVAAALLAGCATAGTPSDDEPTPELGAPVKREIITGGEVPFAYTPPPDRARTLDIAAPLDRLWPTMALVFEEVGLPFNRIDDARHQAATGQFRVQRRLGREQLATYLDCGMIPPGAPAANAYDVLMDVQAWLDPSTDHSTVVRLLVTASARHPQGGSQPVPCSSTGRLERRITDALRARTVAAPPGRS